MGGPVCCAHLTPRNPPQALPTWLGHIQEQRDRHLDRGSRPRSCFAQTLISALVPNHPAQTPPSSSSAPVHSTPPGSLRGYPQAPSPLGACNNSNISITALSTVNENYGRWPLWGPEHSLIQQPLAKQPSSQYQALSSTPWLQLLIGQPRILPLWS